MTDPKTDRDLITEARELLRQYLTALDAYPIKSHPEESQASSDGIHLRLMHFRAILDGLDERATLAARLERVKAFSRDMLKPHGETGVVVAARVRERLTEILTEKEA